MKRDYWQGSPFFFGGGNDVWWAEGITDVADYFRNEDSWSVKNGFLSENTNAYLPRPSLGWNAKIINVKRLFTKCSLHPAKKFATWLLIASKSFEQNWCAESSSLCIRRESVDRNETS